MLLRHSLVVFPLLVAACSGGGGGNSSPPVTTNPPPGNFTDPVTYSSAAGASLPTAAEITAVTHHTITLDGQQLAYTATAGHMTARRLGTGEAQASFFYVAYTLDGAAPATRPVTFFYNGGPGSATVWLHLGSFGPKRLETGEPNMTAPAPYALVDNAESMLDLSDLVFVDAIGSGYSQAIAPNTNGSFWGVDADAAVFRDFVMTYVSVNQRASSPRFIYGESYGGPRAAVMADLLESAGTSLAGVVLQSPAMNYNSNCGVVDIVLGCANNLPSYGAIGSWHGLSNPSAPVAQLPTFMQEVRAFTRNEYGPALGTFLATGVLPPEAMITRLADVSGLARTHWAANPNRGPNYYRVNLRPGTLYGAYDGRVSITGTFLPGNAPDPSSTLIGPSFAQRIVEYVSTQLNYTTPSSYVMLSGAIQGWNFSHDGNEVPDTIPDLASAMAQNPRLKVMAVNGWHDIVTPFFVTERDLERLGNNPNVRVRNYVGGHMTYLENSSRRAMKADLAEFYRSALEN